jgi:hypothetical protein
VRVLTVFAGALTGGLFIVATAALAQTDFGTPATASIIIDDMGYNLSLGKRALSLPGNISYSFLPNTPYAEELAEMAFEQGKQVLLHLPMHGRRMDIIEKDALSSNMSADVFNHLLQKHISAVPHIAGVNNHMGSTVTIHDQEMDWLMQELSARNLFFIDSRTTHLSVAANSARKFNVPFAQRDVFLDNIKTEQSIRNAFYRFTRLALERNGAIAIAHPHAMTLSVLETLLEDIDSANLQLVHVSKLTSPQAIVLIADKDND